jgi:arsenic resistance protein ArsH
MAVSSSPTASNSSTKLAAAYSTLAISESQDSPEIREKYRPFLLDQETSSSDWISQLELSTVIDIARQDLDKTGERLKVLVLYGSLRKRFGPCLVHFA